jgi:hypothetical protein
MVFLGRAEFCGQWVLYLFSATTEGGEGRAPGELRTDVLAVDSELSCGSPVLPSTATFGCCVTKGTPDVSQQGHCSNTEPQRPLFSGPRVTVLGIRVFWAMMSWDL